MKHRVDAAWRAELDALREVLVAEERSWRG